MLKWNKSKVKRSFSTDKNAQFISYIEKFVLPECKNGNIRFFDDAQSVFTILADKQIQMEIATANEGLLRDISVKRLLWLSEHFRYSNWRDDYFAYHHDGRNSRQHMDLQRKKFGHLTDSQYLATLKLGTFTGNGYYRQQCMEQLRDREGALPFLILRMNDWVAQIREEAYRLSQERIQKCGLYEFFQAFPMLEKVKNAGRRSEAYIRTLEIQAENLIRQKFRSVPNETLDEIHNYEIQIKNAVYRFINRNHVLNREQMERLLVSERTGYGEMLLILAIFQHYDYDPLLAEKYLHSKSAVVRYHTLVYRYEQEHDTWPGLQALLLDQSRRIRDYAAYILKKHTDMDIRAFYLGELDQNLSAAALTGIGEHGTKTDAEALRPFLEDERASICKAALGAYGKLAETKGEAVYWRFLSDARPGIAKQAYRCVRKHRIQYGASQLYTAYMENASGITAGYLLNLLLAEPSWTRLPYLLILYCEEGLPEKQRWRITAGICSRHMYSSVSEEQAEMICSLLDQNRDKIPEYIRKGILYDLKFVVRK